MVVELWQADGEKCSKCESPAQWSMQEPYDPNGCDCDYCAEANTIFYACDNHLAEVAAEAFDDE